MTPVPKRKRANGRRSSAWIRASTRYAIYVRDGFLCVWCGQTSDFLTLDHLFPRWHRLHDNQPRYLVTACRSCNLSRKALSLARWLRKLPDPAGAVFRVQRARYVPLNRRAGARARDLARAEQPAPPPPLADDAHVVDGIPF